MKARDWQRFLEEQRHRHDKLLYTVTELANVAGTTRHALNVELFRLVRSGVLVRYAHGIYGPPSAVPPEELVACLDARAYVTGAHALWQHGVITQVPGVITCFTDRHSPRGRLRDTPLGRFRFMCIRSRVYNLPPDGHMAGPEQALLDFVYIARRQGSRAASELTLQNKERLHVAELDRLEPYYPRSVVRDAAGLGLWSLK
jgi:hypothetical protein